MDHAVVELRLCVEQTAIPEAKAKGGRWNRKAKEEEAALAAARAAASAAAAAGTAVQVFQVG